MPRELPPLPDGVRIAFRIPHAAVLPRVRVVLSTGGLGRVTMAACAGVPTLLAPRGSALFLVAEAAVVASMAVRVLSEELDIERPGAALDRALAGSGGCSAGGATGIRIRARSSSRRDSAAILAEGLG